MDNQEKKIVGLIKEGNKEAFRHLFDLYYHRLLLYAKSYVEDPIEAEDIVQELFFNLWEKREELEILTSLSSYLFRAVHNRCLQYLRHRKVAAEYELRHQLKMKEAEMLYSSSSDFTFTEVQFNEMQRIFDQAKKALPDKTQEIFTLSRDASKTNKEIAGLLNIEVKTVEYHITKALKTFHSALRDYFIILVLFIIR